jgi:hypothetical protein
MGSKLSFQFHWDKRLVSIPSWLNVAHERLLLKLARLVFDGPSRLWWILQEIHDGVGLQKVADKILT